MVVFLLEPSITQNILQNKIKYPHSSISTTTSNNTFSEFSIMVQFEDFKDEEASSDSNKHAAFKDKVNLRRSTMTKLTMDKSKSFYDKEYNKEHIGKSREVSTYIHK